MILIHLHLQLLLFSLHFSLFSIVYGFRIFSRIFFFVYLQLNTSFFNSSATMAVQKTIFFNPNYRSLRLSLFELALFIASFSFLQCFLILSGIYFRIRESIGIQKYKIGLYHFTLSFQFNTRCTQKIKDCLTFPGNIQLENWREIV